MSAVTLRDLGARAACRTADPEIFHPHGGANRGALTKARAICADCPVRTDCLEYALAHPDTSRHGIWGGLVREELRALRKARKAVPA